MALQHNPHELKHWLLGQMRMQTERGARRFYLGTIAMSERFISDASSAGAGGQPLVSAAQPLAEAIRLLGDWTHVLEEETRQVRRRLGRCTLIIS